MLSFKRFCTASLLAFLLVLCLQPVYFLAMANLNHVVSHERTWQHIRSAFDSGVLEPGYHSHHFYIDGGDRFSDCYSLGVGLQPGASDLAAGITAARPTSADRHPCDDLQDAALDPASAHWDRYVRYWHGYRLYSAPLASMVSILALKLINLALLALLSVFFCRQASRLIGSGPAIGLFAPVLFCCDYVRIWQVTPHSVSTMVIIGGAALFARAVRRQAGIVTLVALSALFGSVFNFVDFLLNPPWMPMLLAFFAMAAPAAASQRQKLMAALLCVGAWFGAYAVTWSAKWGVAWLVDPAFDFRSDVLSTVLFRIAGDNAKVIHLPLAATLKTFASCIASWGVPLFGCLLVVVVKVVRGRAFDRARFFWHAWPVLIPIVWFEVLSNHSQIHTFFVVRSAAAALGVAIASALIAAGVTREDLAVQARQIFRKRAVSLPSPPLA